MKFTVWFVKYFTSYTVFYNKREGTAWKPKAVYTWKFNWNSSVKSTDRGRADEYTNPIIQLYHHMRPCMSSHMEGFIYS
jgi:hypothetical protein